MSLNILVTQDLDIYIVNENLFIETTLKDISEKKLTPINLFTKDFLKDKQKEWNLNLDFNNSNSTIEIDSIFVFHQNKYNNLSLKKSITINELKIIDISGYYEGPHYTLFDSKFNFFKDSYQGKLPEECSRLKYKNKSLEISKNIERITNEPVYYVSQNNFNYTTWLLDVLPRIFIAKKQGNRKLIIPLNSNMEDLLLLDIYEDDIIRTEGNVNLLKNAMFISIPMINGNLPFKQVFECYDYFKTKVKDDISETPRKILISDNIGNYIQLYNSIKSLGFEILPEKSLNENINIFSNAEIIISSNCDKLSNLVFCNLKCLIIEITNQVNSFHFQLSLLKGLEYIMFECNDLISNKYLVKIGEFKKLLH